MATFSKELLSGSTNGRAIVVAADATPGTLVHTASATAGVIDEVWLYASNKSTDEQALRIEFGDAAALENIVVALPAIAQPALVVVIPGVPLTGGLEVRAFSTDANEVAIIGYVNRITPA